MQLPAHYAWLANEPGPKMLLEGLKIFGTREIVGKGSNPEIMLWAKELGIDKIYTDDDMAWCAVSHAVVAKRAGKSLDGLKQYDLLRAKSFATWGKEIITPMLGDTLVFKRTGGFHVGMYVGEDETAYHVLGGNQGNAYNICRIEKRRLFAARRPVYSVAIPANVRTIQLSPIGKPSTNEA